jgi:hypothetical protein
MRNGFVLILMALLNQLSAQTNVSGGIFTNTNWTSANSPYIVTGNVVVFPGVQLTIDPGVTIKFNNGMSLEIRQSKLIAHATPANPIVFTSNQTSPVKGSWDKIWVNQSQQVSLRNCKFYFASNGLTGVIIWWFEIVFFPRILWVWMRKVIFMPALIVMNFGIITRVKVFQVALLV